MSERDDRNARQDLPTTTGEFRAASDSSASTAQFKAFAAGQDIRGDQRQDGGAWPEQPWAGGAPGNRNTRNIVIAVIVVLIVLIFLGVFLFG
jgi:hypothetical protein